MLVHAFSFEFLVDQVYDVAVGIQTHRDLTHLCFSLLHLRLEPVKTESELGFVRLGLQDGFHCVVSHTLYVVCVHGLHDRVLV